MLSYGNTSNDTETVDSQKSLNVKVLVGAIIVAVILIVGCVAFLLRSRQASNNEHTSNVVSEVASSPVSSNSSETGAVTSNDTLDTQSGAVDNSGNGTTSSSDGITSVNTSDSTLTGASASVFRVDTLFVQLQNVSDDGYHFLVSSKCTNGSGSDADIINAPLLVINDASFKTKSSGSVRSGAKSGCNWSVVCSDTNNITVDFLGYHYSVAVGAVLDIDTLDTIANVESDSAACKIIADRIASMIHYAKTGTVSSAVTIGDSVEGSAISEDNTEDIRVVKARNTDGVVYEDVNVSSDGGYHVVGKVHNLMPYPTVCDVVLTCSFFDENFNLIGAKEPAITVGLDANETYTFSFTPVDTSVKIRTYELSEINGNSVADFANVYGLDAYDVIL